jgi:hypothetical protein
MKLLLENWRKFKLPLIFENSKLPVWLSKIAPIEISALSFFIFVFARGKLDARVKRHETIHYKQQVEMLFVFQWILYAYFHLSALISGLSGKEAYYCNPFELEAYDNDEKEGYLSERKPYAWVRYWREM